MKLVKAVNNNDLYYLQTDSDIYLWTLDRLELEGLKMLIEDVLEEDLKS